MHRGVKQKRENTQGVMTEVVVVVAQEQDDALILKQIHISPLISGWMCVSTNVSQSGPECEI